VVYSNMGMLHEAIADYTQVVAINASHSIAYCNRGIARGRLGHYAQALLDFTQAIEIDPYNAHALYNRAVAHRRCAHALQHVVTDLTHSLALDPSDNRTRAMFDRIRSTLSTSGLYTQRSLCVAHNARSDCCLVARYNKRL
jgi:tetratricopeptide (TPR) repeat protein